MKILFAKKFLLPFETGVVVIKHWRINNYLRSDRYQETKYVEEKALLTTGDNGAYHLGEPKTDLPLARENLGIPSSGIPSIDKDRIDKDRLGKDSIGAERTPLESAMDDFVKHRKAMKKPLTDRGRELILLDLERLAPNDPDTQIAIINQSIKRGWQGVFPLKDDAPKQTAQKSGPPMKTQYDQTYAEPIDDDLDKLARMLGVEE